MNSFWERALTFLARKVDSRIHNAITSQLFVESKAKVVRLAVVGAFSLTSISLISFPGGNFQLINSSHAETVSFNAIEEIEKLDVKGRAPKTGYSRSAFGPQWSDVDRNGCDTRNDILKRDLTSIVFRDKTRNCVVERGLLQDPFSGEVIEFQRGERTSALVQIDHVVALSNAWQTGIFQMSQKVRTNFANDPLNLMAVKGSLNSQKGDGDAATWLPPNKSFRCAYVTRQLQVKVKYGLWLTKPEKEAMLRILQSKDCA